MVTTYNFWRSWKDANNSQTGLMLCASVDDEQVRFLLRIIVGEDIDCPDLLDRILFGRDQDASQTSIAQIE